MDKKLCFEKSGDEVETWGFAILWSSWDIQETEFPGDLVFPNRVWEQAKFSIEETKSIEETESLYLCVFQDVFLYQYCIGVYPC